MKVAAILPAYNEADRVERVLQSVRAARSIHQIIVVDDGSTDATAEIAERMDGVDLISLPVNKGKGAAMAAGARATDAEVLLFLDADLIGLTPEHVEALLEPVRTRQAQMAVGRFHGGRIWTDWAQALAPNISGQRAIVREVFLEIPGVEFTRFGVELYITRFCRVYRVPTRTVSLKGVTHPMKEEKLGYLRGWLSRARMYFEICVIALDPRRPGRLGVNTVIRKITSSIRRSAHGGAHHEGEALPPGKRARGRFGSRRK